MLAGGKVVTELALKCEATASGAKIERFACFLCFPVVNCLAFSRRQSVGKMVGDCGLDSRNTGVKWGRAERRKGCFGLAFDATCLYSCFAMDRKF